MEQGFFRYLTILFMIDWVDILPSPAHVAHFVQFETVALDGGLVVGHHNVCTVA